MTSDPPDLARAANADLDVPVLGAANGAPAGAVPVEKVAPPVDRIAVAPEPIATAIPAARADRQVVAALGRLQEALLSAGRSLDVVAAALPRLDVAADPSDAPGR